MRILCRRCGQQQEAMAKPPFPSELGEKVQEHTCPSCWQEWLRTQVMIINEYRLSLHDPQTRQVLTQHMMEFLNLEP